MKKYEKEQDDMSRFRFERSSKKPALYVKFLKESARGNFFQKVSSRRNKKKNYIKQRYK